MNTTLKTDNGLLGNASLLKEIWQKWLFNAPQKHFSGIIATISKPQNGTQNKATQLHC